MLVALLVVVVNACGGGRRSAPPVTTTTVLRHARQVLVRARPRVAALTGLADPLGAAAHRCAVTVKIDNTPAAQPHYGLEQADVVYEEVVEGGITRLAAVFNSQAPDRVGPVRSVRRTDQSLVWPLRGIFAYSGGAPYAIASIDTAPVVQLDETRAGPMMFRDQSRSAPHNLYAHVDEMYSRCASAAPPPLFRYRDAHALAEGTPAASVWIGFAQGYGVTWTWDPRTKRWQRSLFGQREVSAAGVPLEVTNVVIMTATYQGGVGVEGAEADLVGSGTARVFSAGRTIPGTWQRPDKTHPAQLLDAHHRPIALTPGTTWVELPDISYTIATSP
jgi:hypothetical protein